MENWVFSSGTIPEPIRRKKAETVKATVSWWPSGKVWRKWREKGNIRGRSVDRIIVQEEKSRSGPVEPSWPPPRAGCTPPRLRGETKERLEAWTTHDYFVDLVGDKNDYRLDACILDFLENEK